MKRVLVLMFLAGALTLTALASSYVMVSDSDLANRSSAIVVGRILQARGVMQDEIPWTRYTLAVEESVRGSLVGRIEVDVPGGIVGDVGLKLYGMPSFAPGEKVLLFLSPGSGSSMRLTHQMLGAFSIYDAPGGEIALRQLEDAVEMRLPRLGQRGRYHRPRSLDGFTRWLKSDTRPAEDYFVDLSREEAEAISGQRNLRPRFTLLECRDDPQACPGDIVPIRWTTFEGPGQVPWRIHNDGQEGLPDEGGDPPGTAGLIDSIAAWVNDPDSTINYVFGGTSDANQPQDEDQPVSVLFFDDRRNIIADDFDCAEGGVLANGGPFFSKANPFPHKGLSFFRATRGFVNMNAGIECIFFDDDAQQQQVNAQENYRAIVTHELGHSLGLGHSCGDALSPPCAGNPVLDQAIMRAQAHLDGRGGLLNADDRAAISFLYGDQLEGPGERIVIFPQVGDGTAGSITFTTRFIFHNPGTETAILRLEFFRGEGQGMILDLSDGPASDFYEFELEPGQSIVRETRGIGALQVGYARVISSEAVDGTALFTRQDLGVTTTQAGVPSTGTGTDFSLVFDSNGFNQTGVAIAYPTVGEGNPDSAVSLRLYDADFNLLAVERITLVPGEHFAKFLTEIFDGGEVPPDSIGAVTIASEQPIAVVTLQQNDDNTVGLPGDVPILTTFPVLPGRTDILLGPLN